MNKKFEVIFDIHDIEKILREYISKSPEFPGLYTSKIEHNSKSGEFKVYLSLNKTLK